MKRDELVEPLHLEKGWSLIKSGHVGISIEMRTAGIVKENFCVQYKK